ncbi:CHAT domain-containing protein [Micromonospora sp. DR5-3]|uniref:CHAT domain-containing protein n=1 Tax=unclassified Micromonospora TaxID=2617518 RepID=UPI0011D34175|nr:MULTISPECIES: CHAT domain-containing protein [unclassified Micromonospora]MCW3813158.1 CHAT domain-containing protein [Micromonospora sp. DR5-3]TYC25864.1 CHAT domain-containing protein [Micromonospora sp. MP36]
MSRRTTGSAAQRVTAVTAEYERTGDPSALFGADLSHEEEALAAAAGDRGAGRQAARALAQLHWYRYLNLPGLDGLRERRAAVEQFRRGCRRDPDLVPELIRDECRETDRPSAPRLSDVLLSQQQADRVAGLWQRYRAGSAKALRMLVTLYREWLRPLARERDASAVLLRAALLTDLSEALATLAEETGDGPTYDEALDVASEALAATSAQDPHRMHRLARRGRLFELYFDRGAGPKALELAVGEYRRATQLSWQRHPTDPRAVAQLGVALCRLHEVPEKASVLLLLEATAAWRDAVHAAAPDRPEAASALERLNTVVNLLAREIGPEPARTVATAANQPEVIDRLLQRAEETAARIAVDASPPALAEWHEAAALLSAAVPGFHPARPQALLSLARAELDRWEHGGELGGTAWAATWAQVALDATGPSHPLRRDALNLLAGAAGHAGVQGRDEKLVAAAVSAARAALELTDAQPDLRPFQLVVLADTLADAGWLAGDPDLLDEALGYQREALSETSTRHELYPLRLLKLANLLSQREVLAPDDTLLAEAVETNRRAVEALPDDDSRRIGFLFNHASSLARQAFRRNDEAGLAMAERTYREALALLPPDHPDQPRILSSVAETRYQRYLVGGDLMVLADAVELARQAVKETPTEHHWWSLRAGLLARAAAELSRSKEPDANWARAEAIATYAAIAASPRADAQTRINAERQQAALAREAGDPAARLAALERAVRRMPTSVSRSSSARRRLGAVAALGGLAAEAAAVAIAAGDADRAIELLERGRGLLFHEALGIRSGRVALRTVSPQLATELDRVDRELAEADAYTHVRKFTIEVERRSADGDLLDSATTEWDPREAWAARTRQLAVERDRLIERIRGLPGFADFLRPPSVPLLRQRLAGMPVVVVNTHGDRGDALVMPADPERPVQVVRLPELSGTTVQRHVVRWYAALSEAADPAVPFDRRAAAQEQLHGILAWLWDAVTGPVLDRVAPVDDPAPRIWWSPVGALARLPLHAAGHHRDPGRRRTVLDRTVSSYTPTLTALAHIAADRPRPPATATAAVVGVPTARDLPALSQVRAEVEHVARLVPGSTVLTGTEVAARAVEEALRAHPIAHFACHGEADAGLSAMLTGGLRLGGGGRLSPHTVSSYHLERAELAFLSACSTAETHPTFTDEPLHLAAAFQLAGFPGVIGTTWRTTDSDRIAEAFYAGLTNGGTRRPDTAAAARVLTDTVRAVRDEFPATPTRWAGHLHVGLNRPL